MIFYDYILLLKKDKLKSVSFRERKFLQAPLIFFVCYVIEKKIL